MENNQGTKQQIRTWLENAVREAQNPSLKEQIKRQRQQKMKKIAQRYGL